MKPLFIHHGEKELVGRRHTHTHTRTHTHILFWVGTSITPWQDAEPVHRRQPAKSSCCTSGAAGAQRLSANPSSLLSLPFPPRKWQACRQACIDANACPGVADRRRRAGEQAGRQAGSHGCGEYRNLKHMCTDPADNRVDERVFLVPARLGSWGDVSLSPLAVHGGAVGGERGGPHGFLSGLPLPPPAAGGQTIPERTTMAQGVGVFLFCCPPAVLELSVFTWPLYFKPSQVALPDCRSMGCYTTPAHLPLRCMHGSAAGTGMSSCLSIIHSYTSEFQQYPTYHPPLELAFIINCNTPQLETSC
jgi:hypothetical protein